MPRSAGCYWTCSCLAKQAEENVSRQLVDSISNGEHMNNFTTLSILYLHFTFSTNSMHDSNCAYGILLFF